jgi:hypothetical protein
MKCAKNVGTCSHSLQKLQLSSVQTVMTEKSLDGNWIRRLTASSLDDLLHFLLA